MRVRPERFADHYSQARQFYCSQTPVEQGHMSDALVFELSKVDALAIRRRVVAHLRVIDEALAEGVARGLGIDELPRPAEPAREPIADLKASPALSILKNGPSSFAGRKIGVLISDGVSADQLSWLRKAVADEGAEVVVVAPTVGGAHDSNQERVAADEKVNGGPSVLFDAVAILLSESGAKTLAREATARDFVSDAFAHCKFIAYAPDALPLFEAVGLAQQMDAGCIALKNQSAAEDFIQQCRALRFWAREPEVKQV